MSEQDKTNATDYVEVKETDFFLVPSYVEIRENIQKIEAVLTQDEIKEVISVVDKSNGDFETIMQAVQIQSQKSDSYLNPDNSGYYFDYANWYMMQEAIESAIGSIDLLNHETIGDFLQNAIQDYRDICTRVAKELTGYDLATGGSNTIRSARRKAEKTVKGTAKNMSGILSVGSELLGKGVKAAQSAFTNERVKEDLDILSKHEENIDKMMDDAGRRNEAVAKLLGNSKKDEDTIVTTIEGLTQLEEAIVDSYYGISISSQAAEEFWNRFIADEVQYGALIKRSQDRDAIRAVSTVDGKVTLNPVLRQRIDGHIEGLSNITTELVKLVNGLHNRLAIVMQMKNELLTERNILSSERGLHESNLAFDAALLASEQNLTRARLNLGRLRGMSDQVDQRAAQLLLTSAEVKKDLIAQRQLGSEQRRKTAGLLASAIKQTAENTEKVIGQNIGEINDIKREGGRQTLLERSGVDTSRLRITAAPVSAKGKAAEQPPVSGNPSTDGPSTIKKAPAIGKSGGKPQGGEGGPV